MAYVVVISVPRADDRHVGPFRRQETATAWRDRARREFGDLLEFRVEPLDSAWDSLAWYALLDLVAELDLDG